MLSEFLFLDEDATKDEKSNYLALKVELRQMLNDDFNRRILTQVLLDLRKDISGSTEDLICKLYQNLGLENDAYKKLKSWRWQRVCEGIVELSQMKVNNAYSFICKYVKDPRSIIRKQAEVAIITLNNEGIVYFLDNTKYKISEWQQLKLLDVLRNKNDFDAPSFKSWLTSNNNHVVLFALRLIKHYNQNDARASVIELVKHKNNQIREAAILCIKDFNFVEALETLKLVFWNCSVSVKISILDAIAQLGSESDLEFLNLIETKEANFLVRSKALSCINSIAPESIIPFKGIQETKHFNIPKDVSISKDEIQVGETELFNEINNYQDSNLETENTIEIEHSILKNENPENAASELVETSSIEITEDYIDLNFLPFIIENKTEDTFDSAQQDDINKESISEIEVNFETVSDRALNFSEEPEKIVKTNTKVNDDYNLTSLYFLPVVVENNSEATIENNFLDINVQYDEVLPASTSKNNEHELQNIEVEFSLFEVNSDAEQPIEYLENDIKSFEIIYEEVTALKVSEIEKSIEQENETEFDLSFTPLINDGSVHEKQPEKEEKDITELIGFDMPTASIPEEFVTNIEFDTETRFLLNNIEELGDEREIPFLNELKHDDKYLLFFDQIELLIKKLDNVNAKDKTKESLKPFNVFENLFQHCDRESKLILLDEVYAVGDEKDIDFLKNLIESEDGDVQETAINVLNHLESKFKINELTSAPQEKQNLEEIMQELEIDLSNSEDIYDLNFEPTGQEELLANSENNLFNSFLSQLNIFSSKNK